MQILPSPRGAHTLPRASPSVCMPSCARLCARIFKFHRFPGVCLWASEPAPNRVHIPANLALFRTFDLARPLSVKCCTFPLMACRGSGALPCLSCQMRFVTLRHMLSFQRLSPSHLQVFHAKGCTNAQTCRLVPCCVHSGRQFDRCLRVCHAQSMRMCNTRNHRMSMFMPLPRPLLHAACGYMQTTSTSIAVHARIDSRVRLCIHVHVRATRV